MEDDEGRSPELLHEPPWNYRGRDIGRVLALSDGVFAFAMTLLVIGLVVPAGDTGSAVTRYLTGQTFLNTLFTYVITFFVIAIWWRAHHRMFNYIEYYDSALIRWNSAFLIFIAILPFTTEVLNASGTDPIGVVFFSVVQIATSVALGGLWVYASGRGRLIRRIPGEWVTYIRNQGFFSAAIFALSIPVAFLNVSYAEFVWLAMFAVGYLQRRKSPRPGHGGAGPSKGPQVPDHLNGQPRTSD